MPEKPYIIQQGMPEDYPPCFICYGKITENEASDGWIHIDTSIRDREDHEATPPKCERCGFHPIAEAGALWCVACLDETHPQRDRVEEF